MATSSKRTYACKVLLPGLLLSVPLALQQATVDPPSCQRPSDAHRQVWLSVLGSLVLSSVQSTPVLLFGKSHGWRTRIGYSPQGHKESDTTERLNYTPFFRTLVGTGFCLCPPRASVSPVLWKFCNQIQLTFKATFPGKSQSLCWIPCPPGGSDGKTSACNAGDPGSIPGSGRSPGEGNGNPLRYSCLESSMDRRAWWAMVYGFARSWTQLSNCHLPHRQVGKSVLGPRTFATV